jgi:hypothetical protein
MRAAERLRPPDAKPLGVKDQAVTVVTRKATQSAAGTVAYAGIWAARQARQDAAGSGVAAAEIQVVELHELA